MNISREMLQNSMLLNKLRDVMTMKVIKWLQDEDRRDPTKFESFFRGFGSFIKEGICLAENKHQVLYILWRHIMRVERIG